MTHGSEMHTWNEAKPSNIRPVETSCLLIALEKLRMDRMENQELHVSFGMTEKAKRKKCGVVKRVKETY